jgi:dGTPase
LLIDAYQKNPKLLPPLVQQRYNSAEICRQVLADHIAGMTDRYALVEYRRLFDPDVRV